MCSTSPSLLNTTRRDNLSQQGLSMGPDTEASAPLFDQDDEQIYSWSCHNNSELASTKSCFDGRFWSQTSRSCRFSTSVLVTLTLILAFWGLIDATSRILSLMEAEFKTEIPGCLCGSSDAEAIAMGCSYDHIAVDWLQPHCIDTKLADEFDSAGPNGTWQYFTLEGISLSGPSYIPIEANEIDELAREGRDYYATREWHIAHCMFTWRKQFRSRFSSDSIEPWNDKEGHIKHCSQYIMDALKKGQRLDEVDTFVPGKARHDGE